MVDDGKKASPHGNKESNATQNHFGFHLYVSYGDLICDVCILISP
jgi:hypothetical protein